MAGLARASYAQAVDRDCVRGARQQVKNTPRPGPYDWIALRTPPGDHKGRFVGGREDRLVVAVAHREAFRAESGRVWGYEGEEIDEH